MFPQLCSKLSKLNIQFSLPPTTLLHTPQQKILIKHLYLTPPRSLVSEKLNPLRRLTHSLIRFGALPNDDDSFEIKIQKVACQLYIAYILESTLITTAKTDV